MCGGTRRIPACAAAPPCSPQFNPVLSSSSPRPCWSVSTSSSTFPVSWWAWGSSPTWFTSVCSRPSPSSSSPPPTSSCPAVSGALTVPGGREGEKTSCPPPRVGSGRWERFGCCRRSLRGFRENFELWVLPFNRCGKHRLPRAPPVRPPSGSTPKSLGN